MYKSPYDASAQTAVKRRMFDVVAETYSRKGGTPGSGPRAARSGRSHDGLERP